MSEVDARPPPSRGRSSYRGGRGGLRRGGPRGGRKTTNGAPNDAQQIEEPLEDQGELGEMKLKYSSELSMLRDMFPDWTDVDLVFALQEADGDIPSTVDKITQGNVSQFAEVKSAKDRARSKVKETSATASASEKPSTRGGRARGGLEGGRGSRGRGSDRGRGGSRGGRASHATTNGTAREVVASVPTNESTTWANDSEAAIVGGHSDTATQDTSTAKGDIGQSAWSDVMTSDSTPATASEGLKSSLIPDGGAKKSWASMFAPKKAPATAKGVPASQQPPAQLVAMGEIPPTPELKQEEMAEAGPIVPSSTVPELQATSTTSADDALLQQSGADGEELSFTPSKVPLTEENVEHLPDDTVPPATQTAASTTGSIDPRNLTPLPGQQAPIGRPPMGGYAANAARAAGLSGRSASFQRRVLEQREAVVMPGHNAVDRAAVQFGSMGLNGEPRLDVDEDREDPETRQAPQHSPPSQPKTSLPPVARQAMAPEAVAPESLPTPKQAPGLPPASHQNQQQMQEAAMAPSMLNETQYANQNYQYSRYGQAGMQQEPSAPISKPFDAVSHQVQPSSYDQFASPGQQAAHQLPHTQQGYGNLSSTTNDYSSYYGTETSRGSYNNYYGASYGPQDVRSSLSQSHHDAGLGQQRSASGFGAGTHESAFPSHAHQQVSIPLSLLELNAALENCSNESERQYLLGEIQRVIQHTQRPEQSPVQQPYRVLASVRGSVGVDPVRKNSSQRQTTARPLPLADITNCKACAPSPPLFFQAYLSDKSSKQAHSTSQFTDTTNSGHNTPNPLVAGQQHAAPSAQQSQHPMHQIPNQQQARNQQQASYGGTHSGYPYGQQYYGSPYQQAYQQQAYQGQYSGYGSQQLGGYGGGGGYPAKHNNMYGGAHGYGMGQQSSYDQHSASPANAGAFSQNQQTSMRSASGMSSGLGGLDEYGRASAQNHQQQSGGFGSMNDPFARSASGFDAHSGYAQHTMSAAAEDTLKPYGDTKGGPSPALGQPGRPGSAANSAVGAQTGSLPPPQSQQQQQQQSGFGGAYAGFPGQQGQSQYGGFGALGGQQQQHGQGAQGGYGNYGAGAGFNQTYGGYGSRGGWGSNYGAH